MCYIDNTSPFNPRPTARPIAWPGVRPQPDKHHPSTCPNCLKNQFESIEGSINSFGCNLCGHEWDEGDRQERETKERREYQKEKFRKLRDAKCAKEAK